MAMEIEQIKKNIKYLRKVNNLTQDAVAEGLYRDTRTYRRYEQNGVSDLFTISEIADYYNVSMSDLIFKDMASSYNAI